MNKFRVWSKTLRKYVDKDYVLIDGNGDIFVCPCEGSIEHADVDEFIIERGTGLKDRNSKEICDGDIVKVIKWVYDENLGHEEFLHISKISWSDRYAQFGTDYMDVLSDEITEDFFEVIGNIHENPDLLEGEK